MKSLRTKDFQKKVRMWWRANRRDLPWRRTKDPYRILVSEIMLQQTQVSRVIPKYPKFLKRFPNVRVLAEAPRADVIRVWSGLGYNRRAVNLHRAAQTIAVNYGSRIPTVVEELRKLPGVGNYTAKAVAAFSANAPVAPVDTNIRRILIRHFGVNAKELPEFAQSLLPPKRAGEWSQMLMDFGALVCTSKSSRCTQLGLRHIAEAPRARPQEAFRNSDRFWRGRIVSTLRRKREAASAELRRTLQQTNTSSLTTKRFKDLLRDLEHEGMLVWHRKTGAVRLAQ